MKLKLRSRFIGGWPTRAVGALTVVSALFSLAGAALAQSTSTYTDLHDFGGTITNANGTNGPDGLNTAGTISFDSAGNEYGTSAQGGPYGDGLIWEITPANVYTDLHDFGGTITLANGSTESDGNQPSSGVIIDSAGNRYGTALFGGAYGEGVVWEITSTGSYKDIHDLGGSITNSNGTSGPDGINPLWLFVDGQGDLYGTTLFGGPNSRDIENHKYSGGIAFEITAGGTYKDLHDFGGFTTTSTGAYEPDGMDPNSIAVDAFGNVFGTTYEGGMYPLNDWFDSYGGGTIWEITSAGTYLDLHNFGSNSYDGEGPNGGTLDGYGNYYGTSQSGGENSAGSLWEMVGGSSYEDLHDFGGTLPGSGIYPVADGSSPNSPVAIDHAGNLFGTTWGGAANNYGEIWKFTPSYLYSDLHDFGGSVLNLLSISVPDGTSPSTSLAFDVQGDLFGATNQGGSNSAGIAWKLAGVGGFAPILTAITPNSAIANDVPVTITVAGSGFLPTSVVELNSSPAIALATTFVSPTQLSAVIPASQLVDGNFDWISVNNPGAQGGTSALLRFVINNPVPVISSISPPSVQVGGAAFTLTVNGSGFIPNPGGGEYGYNNSSTVEWNGVWLTTVSATSTQIQATVPASDIASLGTASITVQSSGPGGGLSNAVTLTVASNVTPFVSSISASPSSIPVGGQSTVTVNLGIPATTYQDPTSGATEPGSLVSVSSDNSAVSFSGNSVLGNPGSVVNVIVPQGATSTTLTATGALVSIATTANITASLNGAGQTTQLTILPNQIAGITLSPASVSPDSVTQGVITLTLPEYQGDGTITLTSDDPNTVCGIYQYPAIGQQTAYFFVYTGELYSGPIHITASLNGSSQTATLTVVNSTPPVTYSYLSGPNGSNGWYTGPVTVGLVSFDTYSIVTGTYYTIDGGPQQTYSTPFTVAGDAVHTITFWSVDSSGNTEATNSQSIDIDGTNPTLTFGAPSPAANAAGWNNTSVSIPFTASDATSGVASVTPGSPLTISVQGSTVAQSVVVTDVAGNTATFTSPAFNIDLTAPVTTGSVSAGIVTLSATDNLSGVAATYYTVDGSAPQTYSSAFKLTDGNHTVVYWSVDVAVNVETSHSVSVSVDNVPPVTTSTLSGTAGSNGWYTSSVQVTLSATDNLSGVAATYYTLNGGGQQTYASAFAVSGDGTHAVTYWSVDNAGNVEATHSVTVKIDGTQPTLTFGSATTSPNSAGWYNAAVTLPYTTSDATSGVASATPGSPLSISTQGSAVTQGVTVIDVAGNTATFTSPAFRIDVTAPVTTGSASGTTVTLSATDNLSGVAATYYTIDGGAQQTYSSAFTLANGSHTVVYWSVDVAGNIETSHTLSIVVDTIPPVTTASLSGTAGSNGWYTSSVQITLSATDNLSGVAATYYTLNGGAQQTYSTAFTVSGDGTHAVTYWSVDKAGNIEATHSLTVKIDGTKPVLTFGSATPSPNSAGWHDTAVTLPYTTSDATSGVASATPGSPLSISTQGSAVTQGVTVTDVAGNTATFTSPAFKIDITAPVTTGSASGATVTLSATDNLSGVAATYYTIDGGAQLTYSSAFTVTGSGTHTVKYWSVDAAGNSESAHTLSVTLAAGNVTITPSVASGSGNYWSEEDLKFTSTQSITALTLTITVQRATGGAAYAGEYTNFPGSSVTMSYVQTTNTIVYTYTLKTGQTLSANTIYETAAQFSGNGTAHTYAGDTYSMSVTAGGSVQSYSGAM